LGLKERFVKDLIEPVTMLFFSVGAEANTFAGTIAASGFLSGAAPLQEGNIALPTKILQKHKDHV
jgi:hypothetical protein